MKARKTMKAYLKFIIALGFCFVFTAMANTPPEVPVDGPISEDDVIVPFLEEELLVENCSKVDNTVVCYLSDNVSLPALLSSLDNLNLSVLAVLPQSDRDGGNVYPPPPTDEDTAVLDILKDKETEGVYPRPPLPPTILVIVPFEKDLEEDLLDPRHPFEKAVLWQLNEEDAYPFRPYLEKAILWRPDENSRDGGVYPRPTGGPITLSIMLLPLK